MEDFILHDCRYEQSCSADPDTKTCAAPYAQCRDAMVEILGTNLRTNCACAGTAGDFRELFECIEYQRLFWVNPCVGELLIHFFIPSSLPQDNDILNADPVANILSNFRSAIKD